MHKKRWLYGGLAVLIVLSLVLGTGAFTFYRRIPSVTNQLASQDETTVIIVNPASEDRYPADAAIPITALASSGQPITAMELWVDGSLFAAQSPGADEDSKFFYKTWRWMPLVPGEHILVVRAINLDGSVGTSNLLRINADEAVGFALLHTVKAGDTWDSLMQSCDTDLEAIAGQNPDLDPAADLPVGEQVQVPCGSMLPAIANTGPEITPPLTEQADSSPSSPPGNFEFWLSSLLSPVSALTPAPSLTAGLDGCIVQLLVQDNSTDEQGFEIWRSGVNGYDRIATLGSNTGASFSYEDTVQQSGQVQYAVSAFDAKGKMVSNVVAVNIPDGACGDPGNPNVSYANGILTVPMDLNVAYLYASLDGGAWQRLPPGDDFFTPDNGEVDLRQYLDPLLAAYPNARQAKLKVWGWSNGALQDLGNLSITFDHTSLTFCNLDDPDYGCTGDVGSTHWVTVGEVPSNALNSSRTFQFSANTPGIPLALVQISTRPFGETFQLEDPYMVDSYAIQTEQGDGSIFGKFTVNFSFYQQPNGSDLSGDFILNNSIWPAAEPSPYDENLIEMMKANGVGFFLQEGIPDPVYYIRVVPWDYNKPVGGLSNTVVLTYKVRQEPPPYDIMSGSTPSYELEITGYSPEQKVIPAIFGCVVITAIDEAALRADLEKSYSKNVFIDDNIIQMWVNTVIDSYKAALASGDAICPASLPEETLADFIWGGLNEIFNSIVQTLNSIKNGLVNMIAVGLNGLFGPDFCGSGCKAGLMTALNFAITYFTGLPPTLPSLPDLLENGIDYTVSMAISEAGIPCDPACVAEIRSGVETIIEAMTDEQSQPGCNSNAAHWYGKYALCLPDGLTSEPVPGAAYIPGIVSLQATRTDQGYQMSPDSDYSVLITSTARNEAIVGQSFWFYGPSWGANGEVRFYYTVPEPMEGSLFQPASVALPDTLATGSQLVIPVTLSTTQTAMTGDGYSYPPLLTYASAQAQAMEMPDSLLESLLGSVQAHSSYYLGRPGYSITIEAVLLCYDTVAQGKVPCSEPVTRQFSAEEVQALIDEMNGGQP